MPLIVEMEGLEYRIINGIKAGEESSYKEMYNNYYLLLSTYANNYLYNIEEAREIIQDLVVHLLKNETH